MNRVAPPQRQQRKDTITTTSVSRSKRKKGPEKTWYGWLRGWHQGRAVVLGCIDVIRTNGRLRVNLHVQVFERGRWPYFKKEYLLDEVTIQIPTPLLQDLPVEITQHYKTRIQKLKKHQWMKKRYAR
jgi:hypothetical protein